MLAKPNVSEIMPKVGNRYESALAIAKRARNIEASRLAQNDPDITDAVEVSSNEIYEGKVKVVINRKEDEETTEEKSEEQ